MDHDLSLRFQKLVKTLEKEFGEGIDEAGLLFLIGVNELGRGAEKFSKREKMELIHVAICTLLEPYGSYRFMGRDEDNWPHFELVDEIPELSKKEQEHLLKEAMLDYFVQNGYYHEPLDIN